MSILTILHHYDNVCCCSLFPSSRSVASSRKKLKTWSRATKPPAKAEEIFDTHGDTMNEIELNM